MDDQLKNLFKLVPEVDVPRIEKEGFRAGTVFRRTPVMEGWPDDHIAVLAHVRDAKTAVVLTAGRGDGEAWTIQEKIEPEFLSFYTSLT